MEQDHAAQRFMVDPLAQQTGMGKEPYAKNVSCGLWTIQEPMNE